jgi:tetratricopeptide (TPR) repeat protein
MSKTKTKKTSSNDGPDEVLAKFERGIGLLYDKKWKSAQKVFASLAESQPSSPIAERSRRYIEVCTAKTLGADDGADVYLKAVHAKNEGDLDAALELCARGGMKGRDERFAYLAAAIEGLRENHEEALELLEKAIEMNGTNRVHAFHDPDFQSLRDDPTSGEIFAVD